MGANNIIYNNFIRMNFTFKFQSMISGLKFTLRMQEHSYLKSFKYLFNKIGLKYAEYIII